MAGNVSRYEAYWEMMKANRGCWLELQVPAEYHERVVRAIRKRKGREHAKGNKFYPDFEVTRKPRQNLLIIRLPIDMINTI